MLKPFISLLLLSLSAVATETPPSTGVIIIGDTGKGGERQASVSSAIQSHCESELCNLGMLTGDVVYPYGVTSAQDPILEELFDSYYNKLNLPFLITLGNHDYGKFTNDWQRGEYQLAHAKKNPLFVLPDFFYLRETADSVIAVIDTNRLFWFKGRHAARDVLRKAYKLSKEQDKWFIVMGHHPYLSNGKHGNAGRYRGIPFMGWMVKRILDRHVCGKADFYIAGHEHLLQAFDGNVADCDTQLIVSGTGGSSSEIKRDTPSLFMSDKLGFFHMLISSEEVSFKAIDRDNNILYRASYKKDQ